MTESTGEKVGDRLEGQTWGQTEPPDSRTTRQRAVNMTRRPAVRSLMTDLCDGLVLSYHLAGRRCAAALRSAVAEKRAAPSRPLADTIRAVADGDRDAFSQLYAAYVRMVHAILGPACRSATWTTSCRTSSSRPIHASGSCATRRRSAAGWRRSPGTARPTTCAGRTSRSSCRRTCRAATRSKPTRWRVLDVIRKLPEAYRETLLMRLVEGMTGNEIAERSGLTPASVRVNLHRGMKLLREKLG